MDKSKRIDSIEIGRSRKRSYIRLDKAIVISIVMLVGLWIGRIIVRL
jgi:hypothetical protein